MSIEFNVIVGHDGDLSKFSTLPQVLALNWSKEFEVYTPRPNSRTNWEWMTTNWKTSLKPYAVSPEKDAVDL